MTALISFLRELVRHLRDRCDQLDRDLADTSVIDGVRALEILAEAIEAAMKKTLLA